MIHMHCKLYYHHKHTLKKSYHVKGGDFRGKIRCCNINGLYIWFSIQIIADFMNKVKGLKQELGIVTFVLIIMIRIMMTIIIKIVE